MLHTVLNKVDVLDQNMSKYLVHSFDNTDITSLIPESVMSFKSDSELEELVRTEPNNCTNFTVVGTTLTLPQQLPKSTLPSSALTLPRLNSDDVWNLLHRLSQVNAILFYSKSINEYKGFTDAEGTYMIPTRTLAYSTKHANCSAHCIVSGTYSDEYGDAVFSKRWSTYKIIKDNKLKVRYITVITTEKELEKLVSGSMVKYSYFPIDRFLFNNAPELDELDDDNNLLYVTIDLESIPLVNLSKELLSNYAYIQDVTQESNINTIYTKTIKAFLQELCTRHPDVAKYMDEDEAYKNKNIPDDEAEPTQGVKFSLAGQSNVPSVNACIKALKIEGISTVSDVMNASPTKLNELHDGVYRLNKLQKIGINLLLHLVNEYHDSNNPTICYHSTDSLSKVYMQQREYCKAKLTYIRSMFIAQFDERLFTNSQTFSNKVGDTTLYISFGKF